MLHMLADPCPAPLRDAQEALRTSRLPLSRERRVISYKTLVGCLG